MNAPTRILIRLFIACFLATVVAAPPASAKPAKVTFGAWTPGSPFGGKLAATNALQRSLGRRVKIVNWFQDWGVDDSHFQYNVTKAVRGIVRSGRTPMLTWEPYKEGSTWESYSYDAIASGAYDDYIQHWAQGIAKLNTKVYVRLAHEFNGNWYSWGGPVLNNDAEGFKRMWTHVVDVARASGATNVKWVWCPLTEDVPAVASNRFENYYPGQAYVDVLSLDGYNWGAGTPQFGGWRTFRKIFAKPYKRITRLGPQPLWIAEVGSASDGGNKTKWVRSMFKTARKMKRLKAIVWFNEDKARDWSTAAAASAFRSKR